MGHSRERLWAPLKTKCPKSPPPHGHLDPEAKVGGDVTISPFSPPPWFRRRWHTSDALLHGQKVREDILKPQRSFLFMTLRFHIGNSIAARNREGRSLARGMTRATIEVHHFFSNTTPQFGSLRHASPENDLEKNKTVTHTG